MIEGKKLWPKNISSFKTMTPLVMYHMLNWGHNATILSEIRPISSRHKTRRIQRSGDIKILDAIYLKWEYILV